MPIYKYMASGGIMDMIALIVGLGNIGFRHLRNLKSIKPDTHITVWHQHSKQGTSEVSSCIDSVAYSLKDAISIKPDIAIIANPASSHIETGLELAKEGIHLFIEKPLSDDLERVDELIQLCKEKSLVLMVGYNFRYYYPLQVMKKALVEGKIGRVLTFRVEVGQYLPEWRINKDYRLCASARKDLGGGAVLELSHELDYIRWLIGEVSSVTAIVGHLSNLDIDVEDVAEILLKMDCGAIGSIHLDMIQRPPIRMSKIIGEIGTLEWDGSSNRVRLFLNETGIWEDLVPDLAIDRNDMYIAELQNFLDCATSNQSPFVNLNDAKRVLELALAVKESSRIGIGINI
jgi:predicted dehydrogenase